LQQEINLLLQESEAIKVMEDQMMKRMNEAIKIKKNELRKLAV
jgi:hypothetical protein